MLSNTAKDINDYISKFSPDIQAKLKEIYKIIKSAAPMAEEKISYAIPTFTHHGNLVHFGGFKDHISFFPGGHPVEVFKGELTKYKTSKGTIQIPLDEPLPKALITKIVKFRIKENEARGKKK